MPDESIHHVDSEVADLVGCEGEGVPRIKFQWESST